MCVFGDGVFKPDKELALPKHSSRGRTASMSPWVRAGNSRWSRKAFQRGLAPKEGTDPGMERWGAVLTEGTAWGPRGPREVARDHDQRGWVG